MADVDIYTLTQSGDANTYHFRDERADDLASIDIDVENHVIDFDGENIAGSSGPSGYPPASDLLASLAEQEDELVATKSYYINNFLMVDGVLYRVTSNIANGETIVPNTNVTAVDIGTYLYQFLSQINQLNAKLPAVPNGIGNYFLMASRTVGGGLSYSWVLDTSGEWDYSHITYAWYRDFWRYWSDNEQFISSSQTDHFLVHNDQSVGGAPLLNWEAIYGIPVPDEADTMKLLLPTGAQTTTLFLKIYDTDYYQVLNPDATGVTTTNQTFDLNAMRTTAGSGVQVYYMIAVCKAGGQGMSESEILQYMPSITYEKSEE